MKLRITKRQSEYLGQKDLAGLNIGIDDHRWRWEGEQFVDLAKMSGNQLAGFLALLEKNKHVRGLGAMYTDVTTWKDSFDTTGADDRQCMGCQQFMTFAKQIILDLPHKYLFRLNPQVPGVYEPYYVKSIEFHPKKRMKDYDGGYYIIPEHTDIDLEWSVSGKKRSQDIVLHKGDVKGKIVKTILAELGWMLETSKLMEDYETKLTRYMEVVPAIGKQFLAFGVAEVKSDSNQRRNWWEESIESGSYRMEKDGEPTKVVVDIFTESEKEKDSTYGIMAYVDESFWVKDSLVKENLKKKDDFDEEEQQLREEEANEENLETRKRIPLPHHLYLVVFDLKRHMRFNIHLDFLEPYKYDKEMLGKLILPEDEKALVTLLVSHKTVEFNDIVSGKSGGTIVLLCGQPGTGKTLTAEVLAETMEKPLYSVQASQLGTNESELEQNLMKVLGRAKRWDAIMLLDESDVYVHKRGNDIRQNAIVGVFLRILEYYTSILFLTTNRPEDVDDAVASRCIAKIEYFPFKTDVLRKQAWTVLSEVLNVDLEEEEIWKLAKKFQAITGRDIKNLLKLAKLYQKSKGGKITADMISFLKQFKPTEDVEVKHDS